VPHSHITTSVRAVIDHAERLAIAHDATPDRLAKIRSCRDRLDDPKAALREAIWALHGDDEQPNDDLLCRSWDACDGLNDSVRRHATDAAKRLGICSAALLDGDHNPVKGARGLSWTEYQCSACGEVLWDEEADNDFYD
jgi:hypothetical protein